MNVIGDVTGFGVQLLNVARLGKRRIQALAAFLRLDSHSMDNDCFMLATGVLNGDAGSPVVLWKAREIAPDAHPPIKANSILWLVSDTSSTYKNNRSDTFVAVDYSGHSCSTHWYTAPYILTCFLVLV